MSDGEYLAIARQYEADVLSGRVPACRWVRLACERNRRDRERQGTLEFPYVIDEQAASRICLMAEMLPHIEGPKAKRTGAVFLGSDDKEYAVWDSIQLEPWQCWLLTTIFGWVHMTTRLRRYRTALSLIPRKNSKSTIAAIVVLFMLAADGEMGAGCYSAATTRDQAKVVAKIAWNMAKRSRAFCEFYGVRVGSETTYTLSVPETASKFAPLSADANSLDGLNISFAAVDELHAHKTRAVWDVIETAIGARPQPMLFPITTAGVNHAGICYEKVGYLHRLLEGALVDESFFGVEYTIDAEDDWRSALSHRKANPNYGVSVDPDDLARKAQAAAHSPAAINNFLTKHLNIWVRAESTWAPMGAWLKNGDRALTMEMCKDWPCWIGIDLAEVRDIAAVVIVFKRPDGTLIVFGRYYLPEVAIQQSPIAQYSGWVRESFLIQTDGDQADYERIENDILALCQTFKVQKVCFDRALAAQMGQSLAKKLGRTPEVMTVNQNIEVMNPAMQTVERLTLSGGLIHDGNPVLIWMMSNVVVVPNYKDEVFPHKAGGKDSPNKIDGPVALFTVIGQVMIAKAPARLQIHFLGRP